MQCDKAQGFWCSEKESNSIKVILKLKHCREKVLDINVIHKAAILTNSLSNNPKSSLDLELPS